MADTQDREIYVFWRPDQGRTQQTVTILGVKIIDDGTTFVIQNANNDKVFHAPREAISGVAFAESVQAPPAKRRERVVGA